DVPLLSRSLKGASKDLEELVSGCTTRDKARRFSNAGKVRDQMREVRERMKGGSSRSRVDTAPEIDAEEALTKGASIHDKKTPELPPISRVPSLSLPEAPKPPPAKPARPPAKPPPPPKSRLL